MQIALKLADTLSAVGQGRGKEDSQGELLNANAAQLIRRHLPRPSLFIKKQGLGTYRSADYFT